MATRKGVDSERDSEGRQDHRDFWVLQLDKLEPRALLGGNRARSGRGPSLEVHAFDLAPRHEAMLVRIAGNRDPETLVILLAGLSILIARYGGPGGVAVIAPPLAPAVGVGVPLIIRVEPDAAIKDVIIEADHAVVRGYQHAPPARGLPPELEALLRERNVWIAFDALHPVTGAPEGYDIAVRISRAQGERRVSFELTFDSDAFDRWFIAELADHYLRILDHFDRPEGRVADIEILSEAEAERILALARPSWPAQREGTLVEAFAQQAMRVPDNIAVAGDPGLTYRALDARSNQLARHLRAHYGAGPGAVVGVLLPKSEAAIVAILAILKARAAYLPLTPSTPPAHVCRTLSVADVGLLLMESSSLYDLEGYDGRLFALDVQTAYKDESSAPLPEPPSPSDLAYVIPTSGSTGAPKAVCIAHRSIVYYIRWKQAYYGYTGASVTLQFAPLSFDSAVSDLFSMLLSGGKLVLVSHEDRLNPSFVEGAIRAHGVTTFAIVPSLYQWLLGHLPPLPPSLQVITVAGERVTRALVEAHRRALPGVRLINEYGPSECTVCATASDLTASADVEPPIGAPIAGAHVLVLDERRRLVPLGVGGELWIGGVAVGCGYRGDPAQTEERFVAHPFRPGERLYRSGDRGRLRPDGQLEFLGRTDDQLKVRGNRVEPAEVERALLSHPAVQAAIVVAHPGDAGVELAAYYVAAPALDAARILSHLASILPDYMVPTHLVPLAAMPLGRNGKIDRAALPAIAPAEARPSAPSEPPRDETERALTAIWSAALHRDDIGIHDDFFELGGHSLRAAEVVARIHEILRVEVSVRDVFQHSSVAELSQIIRRDQGRRGERIPKASPADASALSHAELRLFLLDGLTDGRGGVYNACELLFVNESIDPGTFEAALGVLAARHESLRTAFTIVNGVPQRIIRPRLSLPIAFVDLSSTEDAARRLTERARAELGRPIDLGSAPLFRATCARLPFGRSVILFSLHHIIGDGPSIDVLTRELEIAYAACRVGIAPSLPPLSIQYKDFAAWQNAAIAGEAGARARAYWLNKLADRPSGEGLPADRHRPPFATFRGAVCWGEFPSETAHGLLRLGQKAGASTFMVLVALVKALIHRHTGEREIEVGTPVAGRHHPDLAHQFGLYLNTLVLRDQVDSAMRYKDLLGAVRETVLEAYEHQMYPFDRLVDDLAAPRDTGRHPLFDVMVTVEQVDEPSGRAGVFRRATSRDELTRSLFEAVTSKFDLTFAFTEGAGKLTFGLEYSVDLFDEDRIARLGRRLVELAAAVIADPEARIGDLSLLPAEERRELTAFAGPRPGNAEGTLIALFDAAVRRAPAAIAIDGERSLSYSELDERACAVAHRLAAEHGVGRGEVVALLIQRSAWFVIGALGILKAGAAYLPIDPAWPIGRVRAILSDSGSRRLLTLGPPPAADLPALDIAALAAEMREDPAVGVAGDDLAYVIYTSGSTGAPRGVMVEHRSAANLVAWYHEVFGLGAQSRGSLYASVGFDASVLELWPHLCTGGCVVPIPDAARLPPRELAERLTSLGITHAFVPSAICALLSGDDTIKLPPGLTLFTGGEALRLERLPSATVVNQYGPTECTVVATWLTVGREHLGAVPIGRPIRNTQAFLLDALRQPVGVGMDGEIYLGGAGVARGYLGSPDLDRERFVPHPFIEGARLYRTGDVGRFRADGLIEFRGRRDQQVKIRGHRVEPSEIERVLLGHPGVRDAAVVLDDTRQGGRLVGFVVPASSASLDERELFDRLRDTVPGYMVPSALAQLGALPQTSSGKIDRAELCRRASAAALSGDRSHEPACTEVERVLSALWAEVLGRDAIGRHDDFFALGGHSLLAMRLMSRVTEVFEARIPLRVLFQGPTIAAMAASLEGLGGPRRDLPPLRPVVPFGDYPLTATQAQLFRVITRLPRSGMFNIASQLRLQGPLDVAALDLALHALSERQGMLRTRFLVQDGAPVQRVLPDARVPLDRIDLMSSPASEREAEAREIASQEAAWPFTLEESAPLRVLLVRISEEDHVLLLTLHHIAGDGASLDTLIRELCHLYDARRAGRAPALPDLAVQYGDFAVWQRGLVASGDLDEHLAFFRRKLGGPLPDLLLPTDRPRRAAPSFATARLERVLPRALTAAIRQASQRTSATVFMTALTALMIVLCRATGQADVRVGTNTSSRVRPAIEHLIGLFVNTLVFRASFADALSYGQALERVRKVVLEAIAHQDLPFEDLLDALRSDGLTSPEELFRVIILHQEGDPSLPVFSGLSTEVQEISEGARAFTTVTSCDIILGVHHDRDDIALSLIYKTALFDERRMTVMLDELERELAHLSLRQDQPIFGERATRETR
jgi:amino acid adenylation domain-containing protein